MHKFTFFKLEVAANRFVFEQKGPAEGPKNAPAQSGQQNPPEGMSFADRARWRAEQNLQVGGDAMKSAASAIGGAVSGAAESAKDAAKSVGRAVGSAGEAVIGIAAETPGTLRSFGRGVQGGVESVGRAAGSAGGAVVGFAAETPGTLAMYGRGIKRGAEATASAAGEYVAKPAIDALKTAGNFYEKKAVAAFEAVLPVAETLVGLGLMTKDKVAALGKDVGHFTADKFMKAVDWGKFNALYVRDGVVNAARVAADLGTTAGTFWGEVASNSYESAAAAGKRFVRSGNEIYDITTAKGKELAIAAGKAVKGTAQEAIRAVSPVFETLVGLGLIAGDKIAALGTDIGSWTADKFNGAVDWSKFAARYVKNGVVDAGTVAYELGIKDPAKFWGRITADSYESAVASGKKFVMKGKEVAYVTADTAKEYARKAGGVVVGAGKETWRFLQPGIETLAGIGLLAKDKVASLGGDVGNWTADQFKGAINWTAFAARYVKNGVVDTAAVSYEFGIKDPAKFWAKLSSNTLDGASAAGKRFVRAGGQFIDITTQEGRKTLARAQKRGREALGGMSGGQPQGPEQISLDNIAVAKKTPKKTSKPVQMAMPETKEVKSEISYVVKPGDFMTKIARMYYGPDASVRFSLELQKYSLGEVRKLRGGGDSLIKPGEVIKLPKTFLGKERKRD